ncbi:MAG: hypothetical protein ACRDGM_14225 [bacterium]
MVDERDDDLIHLPEDNAPGWFDRFWVNAHTVDGRTTISQGLGVYPNVGVMDAFAIIVRGREQRTVRASREIGAERGPLIVGPVGAHITEPLQRWRFRLDAQNDAGIAYDFTFAGTFAPIDCGRMRDWSHFVQAGAVQGRLSIDGEESIIDPKSWRASRDRSWGLRPETRARFNWVSMQTLSFHLWYLAVDDEAGVQRFAQGWLRHAAHQGGAVEKIERIVRRTAFDESRAFRSAEVEVGTTTGATHRLEVRRLDATVFLRGGLYGGWKGWRHGDRKGALHVEAEQWDLTDADTRREAAGLNDHVCEFRVRDEVGYGIFELNHGL